MVSQNKITVEVPLRISLFGGGSDFPEFFQRCSFGGATLSMALARTIRVTISKGYETGSTGYRDVDLYPLLHRIKLSPDKYEVRLENNDSDFKVLNSGLGSSSALIIASLLFAAQQKGEGVLSRDEIAERAAKYVLEHELPQGIQDEVICTLGGFRFTCYKAYGHNSEELPFKWATELTKYLFLVPVAAPCVTTSGDVLSHVKDNIPNVYAAVYAMSMQARYMVEKLRRVAKDDVQFEGLVLELGGLMREAWKLKKTMNPEKITSPEIERQIQELLNHGVIGAKLAGSGGHGFILCVCHPWLMEQIQKGLGCTVFPVVPREEGYVVLNGYSHA